VDFRRGQNALEVVQTVKNVDSPYCARSWEVCGGARSCSVAWPVAAAAVSAPLPRVRTGGRYPFHLGVASGEPDSTSVVLWTRLARDPLAADGHGGMPDHPGLITA
jgi:alkaline phosphatase D